MAKKQVTARAVNYQPNSMPGLGRLKSTPDMFQKRFDRLGIGRVGRRMSRIGAKQPWAIFGGLGEIGGGRIGHGNPGESRFAI